MHLCVAAYVMVRHYCSVNDVGIAFPKAFRISFLATGLGVLLSQLYFGVNYYVANGTDITEYKEQVLKMMTEMDRNSGQFAEVIAQLSAEGMDGVWVMSMLVGSIVGGLLAALIGAAIGAAIAAAHVKRWREMRDE